MILPARLIRALEPHEQAGMTQAEKATAEWTCHLEMRSNISFNPSGMSLDVIREIRMLDTILPAGLIRR